MFYEEVLKSLQKHGVRYLILGGAAVNLHGVPRMTGDLDIAVDLSSENVNALVDALEEAELKPSLPVDPRTLTDPGERDRLRQEKHLVALTFQGTAGDRPYREVDVLLDNPIDFNEMYEKRERLTTGDITIDVVSLDHLIEIKSGQGREQDLADAEALKKIRGAGREESGV